MLFSPWTVICFITIICASTSYEWSTGQDDDDDIERTTRLIQQPAGRDVRMRCAVREGHADFLQNSQVHWHFKPCGVGYNRTSCSHVKSENELSDQHWRAVDCGGTCRPTLVLTHPREDQSGLYRCSVQPYRPDNHTTLDIQVVRTYELEVIDLVSDAPLILDNHPANTTAVQYTQVVFQCKVLSKVPATILWLRQLDSSIAMPTEGLVRFLNNTYQAINSSGDMLLTEDTYLSKLIIPKTAEKDSGNYACVAINIYGFTHKDCNLNVLNHSEYKNHPEKSMYFLFLIPLGLALVPVLVWLWFIYRRRHTDKNVISHFNDSDQCEGSLTDKDFVIKINLTKQNCKSGQYLPVNIL